MSLAEIFAAQAERDKAFKRDWFIPIFERHLGHLVDKPMRLLEIGVHRGNSLRLWKEWFGDQAEIIGIDTKEVCKKNEAPGIHIEIGSQDNIPFLASLMNKYGPFDVVIDDGSHLPGPTRASFDFLYELMPARGIYIVEDLNCSYWPEYEGGFGKPGTFVEYFKSLVDASQCPSVFRNMTNGMHLYPWLLVIERGGNMTGRVIPE